MFVPWFVAAVLVLDDLVLEFGEERVGLFISGVAANGGLDVEHASVDRTGDREAVGGLFVLKMVEHLLSQLFSAEGLVVGGPVRLFVLR